MIIEGKCVEEGNWGTAFADLFSNQQKCNVWWAFLQQQNQFAHLGIQMRRPMQTAV
jgi:glycerol-3-phosphate dehydrogenase